NTCPGTTANPGVACTDVTANASWSCSNFFGPSGTRAQVKSELHSSSGAANALWDVLYFNVTYLAPTPVSTCSVINTPGVYSLGSNLAGAPNPGSSVSINACVLINTSNVLLDCNNFNITNNGTAGSTTAVLVEKVNNVTVKNCPGFSQYTHGMYVQASNNTI